MGRSVRARGLVIALFLAGCAAPGPPSNESAGADPARAELRESIEELRRDLADLRARLQAYRGVAVDRQDLAGVRAELDAARTAVQALVRDVEQRQLEGSQAAGRRVAAVEARVAELTEAVKRLEAAVGALGERQGRTEEAAPGPSAATAVPPPREPPGAPGAAPDVRTIRRVTPTEAAGETRVSVEADGPLPHRAFTLADPPRLVVDFDNAVYGFDRAPMAPGGPMVDRIRFIQLRGSPSPVIRLILGLRREVPYWIESLPRGLVLHIGASGPSR